MLNLSYFRIFFKYSRSLEKLQLLEQITEKCSVTFDATLKYPKTWEPILLKILRTSKAPSLAWTIFTIWWRYMPHEKELCLNFGKFWYRAAHYKTVHWFLFFFYLIINWVFFVPKYTFSFKALQWSVLAALCSQQLTHEDKTTRIQIPI